MKVLRYITLPAFIVIISSCAKPLISNLQKGTYRYQEAPKNILDVSVSMLPIIKDAAPPEKPKTFFDLRDSLPHIFLKVMATKTNDPDKLISLLSKPLSIVEKEAAGGKPTDYTLYKVRFSYSNIKKYYNDERFMHPNTRLEYLTTSLSLPGTSHITFYNIDKLENEYDEIDLGTLSRDQTVSLNAKLAADGSMGTSYSNNKTGKSTNSTDNQRGQNKTVYDDKGNVIGTVDKSGTFTSGTENTTGTSTSADAKVSASAELDYLNSQTIKEAIAVKLQRLKTGFNFSDRKIMIAQRGRPLGDISDNTYVTATLKVSDPKDVYSLNVYTFDGLFDKRNRLGAATDILAGMRNVNFVPCKNASDIKLSTVYEGAVRGVANEHNDDGTNALEYDDKVTFYHIAETEGEPLAIDKNVFCKNAFKFTAKDKDGHTYVLKIAAPLEEELDIFMDDEPRVLMQWLNEIHSNPTARNMEGKTFKVYFQRIGTEDKVFVINNRIAPSDIAKFRSLSDFTMEPKLP